jgi:hypothetical protein
MWKIEMLLFGVWWDENVAVFMFDGCCMHVP